MDWKVVTMRHDHLHRRAEKGHHFQLFQEQHLAFEPEVRRRGEERIIRVAGETVQSLAVHCLQRDQFKDGICLKIDLV